MGDSTVKPFASAGNHELFLTIHFLLMPFTLKLASTATFYMRFLAMIQVYDWHSVHVFVGSIHIKNWRSLSVDAVTDNLNATVEDVLGDLTSLVTLKIIITTCVSSTAPP